MSNGRESVSMETNLFLFAYYIRNGVLSLRKMYNQIAVIFYLVVVAAICQFYSGQSPIVQSIFELASPFLFGLGAIILLYLLGRPLSARHIHNALFQAGIRNAASEAPFLLEQRMDNDSEIVILKLYAPGITLAMIQDKQAEIEAALNAYVADIQLKSRINTIYLHIVKAKTVLTASEPWNIKYLSHKSFELALGRSLSGIKYINLSVTPHVLIGGTTGSGKSVLLKSLLMQCAIKGAVIYIADFKGGVDFGQAWEENCTMCYDMGTLKQILDNLTSELYRRRESFKSMDCPNLDSYNQRVQEDLPRIVFACDEVAELLDKTGVSKEMKSEIDIIISELSTIARLGRAFGIHLILATQRPDATILPGQIKNNADIRICGRADQVLSQIILDNTDAKDRIPKNICGRFITQDGVMFQGFYSDFDLMLASACGPIQRRDSHGG